MTSTTMPTAAEIAQMIVEGERSTPAKRSAATRALNSYVNRRVNEGSNELRTRAAITGLTNKLRSETPAPRRTR